MDDRDDVGGPPQLSWGVWRTDDNGNTFLVRDRLSHGEAERLAGELESRGHKQLYWVEPDGSSAGS